MDYQALLYWVTGFATAVAFALVIYLLFIVFEWLMDRWPALKRFIEKYS